MDGDDGSESQVDAIAQPSSSAPGSPIVVDSALPDESTVAESPRDRPPSHEIDTEVTKSNPTVGDVSTSIQSDNTRQQEQRDGSSPSPPPPAPSVIEIEKSADRPVSPAPSVPAAKPKSRVQKARSPSPVLPPPPPPPLTVRLVLDLGGPSNYSVNILELAKETGQRHPTPPPIRRDSDSESDDDNDDEHPENAPLPSGPPDAEVAIAPKRRRRRRRQDPDEYYDVEDPFIDDSDLGIDAPTHFAQTKQKGFYVNSGDVTLVLDEPEQVVKKPRKRRAFVPEMPSFLAGKGKAPGAPEAVTSNGMRSISLSGPANGFSPENHDAHERPASSGSVPRMTGEGTRDSPIALLDDGDAKMEDGTGHAVDAKRVKLANGSSIGVAASPAGISHPPLSTMKSENGESTRKRKHSTGGSEHHQFSPELQQDFSHLRHLVSEADFAVKSKFPPQLRAPLAATAIKAVELEEYGEAFFKHLPEIFPYNKFTMTKLVKRLVYERHTEILNERMDAMLENLRAVVDNGFPVAQQGYKEDIAKWEDKQKRRQKPDEGGTPTSTPFAPADGADGNASRKDRGEAPPQQRYKLTDEIKNMIWQLVTINNELAAMTNTMHEWEPDNHPAVSDQSMRKNLYQRIVGVFPEGWINTGLISREFSNMKRKVQLADTEQPSE